MKLLFEASVPVKATVEQVRSLIDDEWVLDAFLGRNGADAATQRQYVDVDHRDGAVGFQGHWWYRGELSASESGGHAVVTYRVYNIAPRGSAWAVPLANRFFIGYRPAVRSGAESVARAIERHLSEAA